MVEEEPDLGDDVRPRDDEAAEQVVHGVGLQRKDGGLRAGQDDGLAEVAHHEGERGGGVGERVCAVEDDEAVEQVVVLLDAEGHARPVGGGDGRAVEEGGEFEDGVPDVAVVGGGRGAEGVEGGEVPVFVGLKLYCCLLVMLLRDGFGVLGGDEVPSRPDMSLKVGRGAMALSRKPSLGARPSGPSCMHIVPPVPMMRTRDSGRAVVVVGSRI